jgi:hypothetical protein
MLYLITKTGQKRKAKECNCKFCGIKFLTRFHSNSPANFCSRKCLYASNTKPKTSVTCAFCKKELFKKTCSLQNSKSGLYFCNRICKESAQKLGGIKEIMPPHYGTGTDNNYRTLMDRTVNPICVSCQIDKKYLLCIHHKDSNHKNDSLDNLEIVCFNCHAKRHLKFENNEWKFSFNELTPRDKLNEV